MAKTASSKQELTLKLPEPSLPQNPTASPPLLVFAFSHLRYLFQLKLL